MTDFGLPFPLPVGIDTPRKAVLRSAPLGNSIAAILLLSADTKILQAIVSRVAVDVIDNHTVRNNNSSQREHHTMDANVSVDAQSHAHARLRRNVTSLRPSAPCIPLPHDNLITEVRERPLPPKKLSCVSFIQEALSQKLHGRERIDKCPIFGHNKVSLRTHLFHIFNGLKVRVQSLLLQRCTRSFYHASA